MADTDIGETEGRSLCCRRYKYDGRLVVEVVGEITAHNAELLEQALRPTPEDAPFPVTVDLRRVDFVDSTGMSHLVQASKRLRSPDARLAPRVVVTMGRQPARVIRLWGLDTILEIVHDLDGRTEKAAPDD